MTNIQTSIRDKYILAVDDEPDILETIIDVLDGAHIDTARDFDSAAKKLRQGKYDLTILDIMGVDGLKLLEIATKNNIPAVMLTAHAVNPDTLMESIQKGAISYLPKELLADLDLLLGQLLTTHEAGKPPWKLLFEKLGDFFDERFGPGWQDREKEFWNKFTRTYQVGRGIQARFKNDERIKNIGI